MNETGRQLADLMNRQLEQQAGLPSHTDPGGAAHQTVAPVEVNDPQHLEKIATLVCELLGARVKPWLRRKLRSQPQVIDDADDLGQLAALAFVEGYRRGRIKCDPVTARHTPASVSAYLWGICNKIFIDAVRRSRANYALRADDGWQEQLHAASPLAALLPGGPVDDNDTQLWEVLAAVQGRCLPQDIVMAYLLGSGFNSGEVQRLLRVSINMPAKALKRVGRALRELCGLDPTGGSGKSGSLISKVLLGRQQAPPPATPLALLKQKRYIELLGLLDAGASRNLLLAEAVAALGPPANRAEEQSLAARQFELRASGDWSWGLLPPEARRALLLRDARMLAGAGFADEGAAQQAAVTRLVGELGNIYQELDQALLGDDLEWLLPLSEHLQALLTIVSEFKELEARYRALLDAADRLGSPRLRLLALMGVGTAHWRLGNLADAAARLEDAFEIALTLQDKALQANALFRRANVYWSLSDYAPALENYQRTYELALECGDRCMEGRALGGIGLIYHGQGDYERSLEYQSQALAVRREIGDKHGEANSLGNLATIYGMQGDNSRSAEHYVACRLLCRELGDRRGEANSLRGLALIHASNAEYAEALEIHQQATDIFRALSDLEGESYSLRCTGNLHFKLGEYSAAGAAHQQALNMTSSLGDRYGQADCMCTLADVALEAGDFSAARRSYSDSLRIYFELEYALGICKCCACSAALFAALGDYAQATVVLEGALHSAKLLQLDLDEHGAKPVRRIMDACELTLSSAEVNPDEVTRWRSAGTTMSFEQLGHHVLAGLESLTP